MERFPGKRIFITGAASGLGRALAQRFAAEGWRVGIADIHDGRSRETAEQVRRSGGEALSLHCDVTVRGEFVAALEAFCGHWGTPDIFVNNAGMATGGYLEKMDEDHWKAVLDRNFMSVVYGCAAVIPLMKREGGGHLVNVASAAGIASMPEMASYNATKAAVISLSETLSAELAPHGIGVTVCCPTFVKTNLMESFISTDERQRVLAGRFFERSRHTPEQFAEYTYRSIEHRRLYSLAQFEGRMLWRLKRLMPERFVSRITAEYRKRLRRAAERSGS